MPKQSQLSAEVKAARMEITKMRRSRAQCRVVNKDKPTELMLYGTIGGFWGEITARSVASFLQDNAGKDVSVRMNTPGGDVFESVAISSLIRDHDGKVTMIVDGLVASAGVGIALSGAETVMTDNAQMMIHNPWSIQVGEAKDMRKMAAMLDKTAGTIADGYAKRTGKDKAELVQMMNDETWMTADEAKANGFVDRVIDSTKKKASVKNVWNSETYHQFVAAMTNRARPLKNQDSSTVDEPDTTESEEFVMNEELHAKCVAAGMDSKLSGDEAQTWLMQNGSKVFAPAEPPKPEDKPEPTPPAKEEPKAASAVEILAVCEDAGIDMKKAKEFVAEGATIDKVKDFAISFLKNKSPDVQDDDAAGDKPKDPDAEYDTAFAEYKASKGILNKEQFINACKVDAGELSHDPVFN